MQVAFHPDYFLPLPPSHPFPMGKYPGVHAELLRRGLVRPTEVVVPDEAPLGRLRNTHTDAYLTALAEGTLEAAAVRRLGVPWQPKLWRRARLAVEGTWLAAQAALRDGIAANLAGGTHHAFAGHGEGFCVLNDVVITLRALREAGLAQRFAIVDLDVHQGNGTAALLEGDAAAFTFSMHGERNYPLRKERSTLDIGLPDAMGDEDYLSCLRQHLPEVLDAAEPDLVFYLAGVDVVHGDRYGKLALTEAGLLERERTVLAAARARGLPLVVVLAGGYAPTVARTVELHCQVFEAAASLKGMES